MGLHEGAEKVLAAAYHRDAGVAGKPHCTDAGIGCRTVHLHVVLIALTCKARDIWYIYIEPVTMMIRTI